MAAKGSFREQAPNGLVAIRQDHGGTRPPGEDEKIVAEVRGAGFEHDHRAHDLTPRRVGKPHHGGFGEYCYILPRSWILKLPPELSDEEAPELPAESERPETEINN